MWVSRRRLGGLESRINLLDLRVTNVDDSMHAVFRINHNELCSKVTELAALNKSLEQRYEALSQMLHNATNISVPAVREDLSPAYNVSYDNYSVTLSVASVVAFMVKHFNLACQTTQQGFVAMKNKKVKK